MNHFAKLFQTSAMCTNPSTKKLVSVPMRSMFIQTASTPNVNSVKFLPGKKVLEEQYGSGMDFRTVDQTVNSPFARDLFKPAGVNGVFFGPDFISITKHDDVEWNILKPKIFEEIMNFYASNSDVIIGGAKVNEYGINEGDSEIVMMIKELLDTRIRPALQEDGGDIFFHGFEEESGVVSLQMAGSCVGCASSSITMKNGVENMLMHYIPEVKEIKEIVDEAIEEGENEFLDFEKKLENIKKEKKSQEVAGKSLDTQAAGQETEEADVLSEPRKYSTIKKPASFKF